MRQKQKVNEKNSKYRILLVDDEIGVIDSLTVVLGRNGYSVKGTIDPLEAVDILAKDSFDLMVLDYLMNPIHGDEVVRRVREFNKDIYILLLTGHKDLAPPIETIKSLEIQGYCEKSDRFDQLILLVESGIKSIEQMKTVKHMKDGLNSILQVAPKIHRLQPMDDMMREILNDIPGVKGKRSAFIVAENILDDSTDDDKHFFKGIGHYENKVHFEDIEDKLLKSNIELSKKESKIIDMTDGVIFPLLSGIGKSAGALYFEGRDIGREIDIIKIYVNQAATAINNALLHNLINLKNNELSKTYNLLKDRYMDTVETLRLVVDAKDVYTRGHSDRVSYFACKIGEELGLSDNEMEILRVGGLFHDVGKVSIPDKILLKTSKLSEEEYEVIKRHPQRGNQILSGMSVLKDMMPLIVQHHERIDGNGYPNGLSDNEIDPLAKIISVADAFDAMQSDRSYRHKFTMDEITQQLEAGRETQFDSKITDTFLKLLEDYDELCKDLVY